MYRSNDYPILPVGRTNMLNGKNAEYTSILNLWEEDANDTYVLVKIVNWAGEVLYRAIITSGNMESTREWLPVGKRIGLVHDQTGARFGQDEWTICGHFPNTREGLRNMANLSGLSDRLRSGAVLKWLGLQIPA